jgi:hypothetical protein
MCCQKLTRAVVSRPEAEGGRDQGVSTAKRRLGIATAEFGEAAPPKACRCQIINSLTCREGANAATYNPPDMAATVPAI